MHAETLEHVTGATVAFHRLHNVQGVRIVLTPPHLLSNKIIKIHK